MIHTKSIFILAVPIGIAPMSIHSEMVLLSIPIQTHWRSEYVLFSTILEANSKMYNGYSSKSSDWTSPKCVVCYRLPTNPECLEDYRKYEPLPRELPQVLIIGFISPHNKIITTISNSKDLSFALIATLLSARPASMMTKGSLLKMNSIISSRFSTTHCSQGAFKALLVNVIEKIRHKKCSR